MSDSRFPIFALLGLIVLTLVVGRDWVVAHTNLVAPIAIALGLIGPRSCEKVTRRRAGER